MLPSDLEAWEEKNGKIPDDIILLLFFDWGKRWPDKLTYLGTDTNDTSLLHFPGKEITITAFFFLCFLRVTGIHSNFRLRGPFLESPGNFTGPKSKIQIEI